MNSAGYDGSTEAPITQWTSEMLDEMLSANVRGTYHSMKYELEIMQRQGSGAIVNIGSDAGVLGVPGHSGYVASKHAGIGMPAAPPSSSPPKASASTWCAPALSTHRLIRDPSTGELYDYIIPLIAAHPIGRIAQSSEVADAVVWLASGKAATSPASRCPSTVELRQFRHVLAVAEERSITRAAKRELIVQSGLSNSIRALERELGTPLYVRGTRPVRLTAAGEALVGAARRT
jgi:hypothetical protein